MNMATDDDTLVLAGEFPPATRDAWLKLVDGVLKGAPFERLTSKTADGLTIQPLYPRAAGASVVAGRAPGKAWQLMQRVDHPDPAEANKQALADLENGATGLSLVFAAGNGARGFGLPATADAIEAALKDIHLEAGIAIEFQIGPESKSAPILLADILKKRGIAPAACNVRTGFDPISVAAARGGSRLGWADLPKTFAAAVTEAKALGFKGPFAFADGRVIHDAGGSEAQELAYVLASGVAYLRALEAAGIALDDARGMIQAYLCADADQFLSMAKFRAVRRLWARVEQACGLTPKPLFIAAETAWRMLTQRDTDVNMLRATMATFAAGLGGADSITVLPHTLALGLPDPFARRVARNTQLILLEESNLAKVMDPAAGSGGLETLTSELSASAWSLFQQIEKAGGIFAALQANLIQQRVAQARDQRAKDIARRKQVVTGVSEFALLTERKPDVRGAAEAPPAADASAPIRFDALRAVRLAAPFEALRDKSDAILEKTGARPNIFLANLGTAAEFTARSTFAKSFFEAGGIEVIDNEGYWEIPTLVHFFKKAGSPRVCLCSSDTVYSTNAADAAKALAEAGASHIYLAGRPGPNEAAWRTAGVNEFVYVGCDALATLQGAYGKLGQS
jgi:methylmalonyl-CoA mutase